MAGITGRTLLLSALALLAAALLAPAAQAANFTVNSLADGNDGSPGDGVCQTATPGQCTFRAAVQEANTLAGNDTIGFSVTGVHTLSPGLGHIGIGTSSSGNVTITGNGDGSSGTVLSAGGSASIDTVLLVNASPATTTVSLNSLRVEGLNSPGANGGIVSNGGTLTLSRVTVTGNTGGGGAGVSASGGGALNVIDSTVSNNTNTGSGVPGGGIAVSGAVLNLLRSAVTGNATNSADGSGVFTSGTGSVIANSTIAANSGSSVGAVRADNPLTIRNSTIAGNSSGALVAEGAPINVGNSIFSDSGTVCSSFAGGTFVSAGNNIFSDGTCSPGASDKPSTNPQLAALLDNGGPTQTMAIYESSPALNAGSASLCAAAPVNNVDQRGISRPQLSGCDIGAFEYAPYIAPKPTRPDNSFKLGKLKLKRNGTAILPVTVPGPGLVTGSDLKKMKKRKLVKATKARPKAAATVRLKLKPTDQAKLQLFLVGKIKTKLKVSFTPTGGSTNSKRIRVKLAEK